jgi:hypothetical protein
MTETPPGAATAAAAAIAAAPTLASVWTGYITGTNRGRLRVLFTETGARLDARVLLTDLVAGRAVLTLRGTRQGRQAMLRILTAHGGEQGVPLDGVVILEFTEDYTEAQGPWHSEIGTQGQCVLRATRARRARWWLAAAWTAFVVRIRHARPLIYGLGILALVGLDVYRESAISVPLVILVLVLAPLLMPDYIKRLLVLFGVKKAGPFEFHEEQQPLPTDLRQALPPSQTPAAPPPAPPAAPGASEPVPATEEELATFRRLNDYLAPRTKVMLQLLAWDHKASWEHFRTTAEALGVPAENIDVTRDALLQSGCVAVVNGFLVPTRFGRRYLDYLLAQGAPGI